MANITVIDDQATFSGASTPSILYAPRSSWKSNSMCVDCNITHEAAVRRVSEVAKGGTWTNAWWAKDVTSVSATTEFEGTMVAVYFIMFYRSLDPESTGIGTLYFFVDDRLELQKRIEEREFNFQYDISPRTLVFQKSFDANQSTTNMHSLRIIWTHSGIRPRVAVALDSVEYIASPPSSNSTGTSLSPSATSTSKPSSSNRTVKIVLPIVSVFAVALLGALAFFLLRRRRQQRSVQATVRHTPGRQRGYHYVPTSQIEGARGRRVSIASMVSRDYQTDSAPQSPPTPHRDPPGGRAGYIDPYPFNIVPRTYPSTQRAGENFPRTGSVLSDPTPQDIASPAQTN
ncbi:hypothetical protein FA13DRAFT_1737167 [Coprinellus micaceus]|uniref:Uncharacterized protein n=1 Tax=Coprinellus micaceus TaxID=71717 RepID=A0A4Y7SY29_COPMI|nr:hypothetical protein FA13DRAFT_1737167 [Coprinellus micaceus]